MSGRLEFLNAVILDIQILFCYFCPLPRHCALGKSWKSYESLSSDFLLSPRLLGLSHLRIYYAVNILSRETHVSPEHGKLPPSIYFRREYFVRRQRDARGIVELSIFNRRMKRYPYPLSDLD